MPQITETILRDAHQSLAATRMRTADMLDGLEMLDNVGYRSIEMWGGATFDVCIRFLAEDPWARLRQIKAGLKNTPTQMLLRGQSLVGYEHYADDVVDLFVECAARNGVDIFRIFDALNDRRNMERAVAAVLKAGKHAQGTICYTTSPVHTTAGFVKLAEELVELGCDSICVKDMAGILRPIQAFDMVSALKKRLSVPIQVHTHNTAGYASATYYAAAQAGADAIDCALSPMANGTSQPATEAMIAAFQDTPWSTGLNLNTFLPITDHFIKVRKKYDHLINPISERVDVRVMNYQMPGGMISNFVSQLEQQNKLDKFEEVLAEVPRVREELGWTPLVTPTSQIVGTQAALNILGKERYKLISKETTNLLLGYYGKTPAPVSEEIQKKAARGKEPINVRPGDVLEPKLASTSAKYATLIKSDEDLLILALFASVGETFLKGEVKSETLDPPVKSSNGSK